MCITDIKWQKLRKSVNNPCFTMTRKDRCWKARRGVSALHAEIKRKQDTCLLCEITYFSNRNSVFQFLSIFQSSNILRIHHHSEAVHIQAVDPLTDRQLGSILYSTSLIWWVHITYIKIKYFRQIYMEMSESSVAHVEVTL